ncbi:MAG: DUF4012 domain-containing protein [Candidatus Levybacteria bacterium]|nr:DUF4012 domain-containing protein [Candidatus Levybacteria bacterium]
MKRPQFETIEKKRPVSILIIDKEGVISSGLLSRLPKDTGVVVVGSQRSGLSSEATVSFVHFGTYGMPSIPDTYYSHIFVIINGEKDIITLIPQFLEKARTDDSKIFFVMDLFFAQPAFLQDLTYDYRNAHAVVTGDFFGKITTNGTIMQRFLHEANTKGIITVPGDGLTQTFPVLFDDAMEELVHVAFLPKAVKITYVFPKHAPTQLSLARILQSVNPFLRIDFVDEKTHNAEVLENIQKGRNIAATGFYALQNNYPLLKKIKDAALLSEENVVDSPKLKKENAIKYKKLSPRSPSLRSGVSGRAIVFPLFFFLFLFALPFLLTILFSGFGVGSLAITKQALTNGDLTTAAKSASASQSLFGIAKTTSTVVVLQAALLGLGSHGEKLQQTVVLGEEGSYALRNVISAAQTMLAVFNKKSNAPHEDFISASNKLKKAVTIFQKLRAQNAISEFSNIDTVVSLVGATIDSYPTLLGMDGKKTYLLLFHNNAELRPAGGFIGSYGLLTLDKGSISDFQIHDVYDADGQLKGHVEPAYPFRRYMGIVHQYMRDSNYAPDFPTAASTSANMFAMETNQSVSGVIGIDTSFVKSLVEALQPIYVPDYKETVTAENFYMVTQSHAEKDFFPGSTQKKDFLRSLFAALQLKLADQKQLPYLSLANVVTKSILEKHIVFAFPDVGLQQLFSANNLSSSLTDSREKKEHQYNDFFGISETNIGANKANAFVYRKVEQRVALDDVGSIKNTVTIRYKNDSKDWPGGDYKNYVRIITPKDTQLSEIIVDGQKQLVTPAITDYLLYERPDFTPPPGLEVETAEEHEKTLFGFLLIVPKGTFKTVTISYVSPTVLDMGQQTLSYNLWYFKQPGTDAYPYSFIFSYPENFKAFRSSNDLSTVGNTVVMEKTIVKDQYLYIDLSKK